MGARLPVSFFALKTATLTPELQFSIGPSLHLWFCAVTTVSMGPRPHLSICDWKNVISIRITSLYGSQPSSVVFAPKTTTFGLELQVSLGPRPHLRFLPGKQQLFYQNYKSLWLPDFACWFVNAKQRAEIQNDAFLLVPPFICGFVHSKQRL